MCTQYPKNQTGKWEAQKVAGNKAPYHQLIGLKVVDLSEGFARLTIPVDRRLNNRLGHLHGGILTSMADAAAGEALLTMIEHGERPTTVELNINYLSPVHDGQLVAEAQIVSRGRTIAVADVDISDETGRLVAKSRATYMVIAKR